MRRRLLARLAMISDTITALGIYIATAALLAVTFYYW